MCKCENMIEIQCIPKVWPKPPFFCLLYSVHCSFRKISKFASNVTISENFDESNARDMKERVRERKSKNAKYAITKNKKIRPI